MEWSIERTDTLIQALKEHRKNAELLHALENKIKRLKEDPTSVGGMLCGPLHGLQSTRLVRKFRLLFKIDENLKTVYLVTIDHRKDAYD